MLTFIFFSDLYSPNPERSCKLFNAKKWFLIYLWLISIYLTNYEWCSFLSRPIVPSVEEAIHGVWINFVAKLFFIYSDLNLSIFTNVSLLRYLFGIEKGLQVRLYTTISIEVQIDYANGSYFWNGIFSDIIVFARSYKGRNYYLSLFSCFY